MVVVLVVVSVVVVLDSGCGGRLAMVLKTTAPAVELGTPFSTDSLWHTVSHFDVRLSVCHGRSTPCRMKALLPLTVVLSFMVMLPTVNL